MLHSVKNRATCRLPVTAKQGVRVRVRRSSRGVAPPMRLGRSVGADCRLSIPASRMTSAPSRACTWSDSARTSRVQASVFEEHALRESEIREQRLDPGDVLHEKVKGRQHRLLLPDRKGDSRNRGRFWRARSSPYLPHRSDSRPYCRATIALPDPGLVCLVSRRSWLYPLHSRSGNTCVCVALKSNSNTLPIKF